MRWLWRWPLWRWPPWRRDAPEDGHDATQARAAAEQVLRETRARWPEVHRAGDALAVQVERALRGRPR